MIQRIKRALWGKYLSHDEYMWKVGNIELWDFRTQNALRTLKHIDQKEKIHRGF